MRFSSYYFFFPLLPHCLEDFGLQQVRWHVWDVMSAGRSLLVTEPMTFSSAWNMLLKWVRKRRVVKGRYVQCTNLTGLNLHRKDQWGKKKKKKKFGLHDVAGNFFFTQSGENQLWNADKTPFSGPVRACAMYGFCSHNMQIYMYKLFLLLASEGTKQSVWSPEGGQEIPSVTAEEIILLFL